MKQRKVLYPECMRKPHKAKFIPSPTENIANSPFNRIHMAVSKASEFLDADGNVGWALWGTNKTESYCDPKFTEFVVFVGWVKIKNHCVKVYEWRNKRWVRGTHGTQSVRGGRVPADRWEGWRPNAGVPAHNMVKSLHVGDLVATVLLPWESKNGSI